MKYVELNLDLCERLDDEELWKRGKKRRKNMQKVKQDSV